MQKENIKSTLLISTYNWPQALELVLKSVLAQTVMPDEILIADDGSKADTKKVIDNFRLLTDMSVKHLWHSDQGFRKTIILNEAIRASSGIYIIQTDGDIILHPLFIAEHLNAAKHGTFIRGSRTLINKESTEMLIQNHSVKVNFFSNGLRNRINSLHSNVMSCLFSGISPREYKNGVIGCNFSYWKKDFIEVNGYNNNITGWGQEDSELGARLVNNGIKKNSLKYQAICFHLFHSYYSRERNAVNENILQNAIEDKITICANGFSSIHPVFVW